LVLFALLPDVLVRHPLAPPEMLIWTLMLFPLSVSAAIVRYDFLDMPSLLYRRTLHLVLHGGLLVTMALIVGLLLAFGPLQVGWVRIVFAVGTTVLLVLTVTQWARLVGGAERLLLPDSYDPLVALHRLHKQIFLTEAHERGMALLREVGDDLDLRFAVLQTAHQQYVQGHPREPISDAVLEAVTQQAQALLTTPPAEESWVEQIAGMPVRIMPIGDQEQRVRAVLCIGPKHCGDAFTAQDEAILAVLRGDLEAPFFYQQAEAQVAEKEADGDEQASSTLPGMVLTVKQVEVLISIAEGCTNEQIAAKMKRNVRTIEQHVSHIRKLLGVATREEAVRVARQEGLLLMKNMPAQKGSQGPSAIDTRTLERTAGHKPPRAPDEHALL